MFLCSFTCKNILEQFFSPSGYFSLLIHSFYLIFQDAKKGVLFIDFPPVLQLQLKRFEYDFTRDTMVKVDHLKYLLSDLAILQHSEKASSIVAMEGFVGY